MFVEFDKNNFCQALLFRSFVIEVGELLTADTMGQRLCLCMNSTCNSHYKLNLKQKNNCVPYLSTSYVFHKID